MSRKPYDELPWWCQLLWPWSGPPWYEQVADMDAYLAAYWCALHLSAAELAELLAGDDPPGEGCLAKARRLTAARRQAQEIISGECLPGLRAHDAVHYESMHLVRHGLLEGLHRR